jgi:Tfp pilus assembly protein PilN
LTVGHQKITVINKINLATHPFRNRTLPYLLALACCTFALAGVIFGLSMLRDAKAEDEVVKGEIEQMKTELAQLKGESDKIQQMLTPEQRALLIAAHKLVAQKNFGWSRLFADLEGVLPNSVSVSRINVENVYQTSDRTQAELDFAVLSRDYESVMNMINKMNAGGVFQAELRGQDLQKKEHFTYTEYSLRLIYTQPLSHPTDAPAYTGDVASNNGQGGAQ